MFVKIAIVDDETSFQNDLKKHLNHFSKDTKVVFEITSFSNGEEFLNNFKDNQFDIVFMDINIPGRNGLEISKDLRKIDKQVILIFLTNLAQYAIKGYEVDALDYVLKPITFSVFLMKMQRAIQKLEDYKPNFKITFSYQDQKVILDISKVKYFEVKGHKLTIHSTENNYQTYDYSLKDIEDLFIKNNITFFSRINNYLLINLNYVTSINKSSVYLNEEELPISRSKKTNFIEQLSNFYSQGKLYV